MRSGITPEEISLRDGLRLKDLTLEDAINEHPEVKKVILIWAWEAEYYSSNAMGIFSAYTHEHHIDQEYSFEGDREDALEFAKGYDCWDGHDFLILHGDILYSYNIEYDPQTSWNDGYDHMGYPSEGYDPRWLSWLRVDFDPETITEYILKPGPIPNEEVIE